MKFLEPQARVCPPAPRAVPATGLSPEALHHGCGHPPLMKWVGDGIAAISILVMGIVCFFLGAIQ